MSTVNCIYPLVNAFGQVCKRGGWRWINNEQWTLIRDYLSLTEESVPELKGVVSDDADTVNRFLGDNGFSLRIGKLNAREFASVSLMTLLLQWREKASVTSVERREVRYPAIRIGKNVKFFSVMGGDHPVARILTENGDFVFLTPVAESMTYSQPFSLLNAVHAIEPMLSPAPGFDGVVFPMVNMDVGQELADFAGAYVNDDGRRIVKVIAQNILKVNEYGALAKNATVAVATRSFRMPAPDMVINQPFLLWIRRDGLTEPLFITHVAPEFWENPGELE